ncbi:MAG TPA: MaoC family dehydratase N-terminal domain-containing protein [Rhizomicrobium sp.]|nr:MaoC family dehydratase N-terminal domain-containing protein [Rhizomicrobium sp.]
MSHLQDWIGRSEVATDIAGAGPLAGLAALLDHESPPGNELPPLSHWLYFLQHARQSELGEDGHPKRGGFLPPVQLPRRMWAGGRLTFHAPIAIGAVLERRSTIKDISEKTGTTGNMVFVTVAHEISADGRAAVSEEQDIVFRDMPKSAAPPAKPEIRAAQHMRRIVPDPALLFRFSALTFNAHRIHYDRDYAVNVERYPGLVVQGPFIAILLADHYLRHNPRARISQFSFRAQRPLFDTAPFDLCLAGNELWTLNEARETTFIATV